MLLGISGYVGLQSRNGCFRLRQLIRKIHLSRMRFLASVRRQLLRALQLMLELALSGHDVIVPVLELFVHGVAFLELDLDALDHLLSGLFDSLIALRQSVLDDALMMRLEELHFLLLVLRIAARFDQFRLDALHLLVDGVVIVLRLVHRGLNLGELAAECRNDGILVGNGPLLDVHALLMFRFDKIQLGQHFVHFLAMLQPKIDELLFVFLLVGFGGCLQCGQLVGEHRIVGMHVGELGLQILQSLFHLLLGLIASGLQGDAAVIFDNLDFLLQFLDLAFQTTPFLHRGRLQGR
mmetsp:Transcript_8789/g.25281  ORF Transcript_8789/g.25281 Transcript_8789/m.25281 type:complete len:294 (+) Transcript_8789:237-1118(+)